MNRRDSTSEPVNATTERRELKHLEPVHLSTGASAPISAQSDVLTPEERRSLPHRLASLIRTNALLLSILACAAIFLLLLREVTRTETIKIDAWAYSLIVERLRAPWLTPIMSAFSALASPIILAVLLLVIAAFAPGRRPGWCCTINLGLVALLNLGLKSIVQRPRPIGFRIAEASGFSFPSGHSMVAMAFFGLIVWLVWHYGKDQKRRVLLTAAFAIIIVMIGVSRIYLGVHYASDVLAGFMAALIWLAVYTRLAVPLFLRPRS
ncbi:phosphatase PAP2 family protein [Collinsella sp. AGMB00827]|uniref:Phosphatase PAP2 family protein n=1 Tax=Collinsella ureilytica TaxID=2869515 RepID=A0ABS7MLE7_9ACTN|nr:phosphatase PAP2 family protein [Collinsella urealyticum]MBY4797873.1 phosphatase PAP2 family protein [Collinsella urealyticum]